MRKVTISDVEAATIADRRIKITRPSIHILIRIFYHLKGIDLLLRVLAHIGNVAMEIMDKS